MATCWVSTSKQFKIRTSSKQLSFFIWQVLMPNVSAVFGPACTVLAVGFGSLISQMDLSCYCIPNLQNAMSDSALLCAMYRDIAAHYKRKNLIYYWNIRAIDFEEHLVLTLSQGQIMSRCKDGGCCPLTYALCCQRCIVAIVPNNAKTA